VFPSLDEVAWPEAHPDRSGYLMCTSGYSVRAVYGHGIHLTEQLARCHETGTAMRIADLELTWAAVA
jgi:hypothetical protein